MRSLWEEVAALPIQNQIVAAIVLGLLLLFLVLFLAPGIVTTIRLSSLLKRLRRDKAEGIDALARHFANDNTLVHLWSEYRETLHHQRELNSETGELEVTAVRSTVPAEMFFSSQAVIDSRLRTEFFKHLPGIFTGVGIIGTFLGLIGGLQKFRVTENPIEVRASLEVLVHGVGEAFLISSFAIAFAMGVTFVEKWLLSSLYRKVEELSQILDSMFEAGAGEEYLSRLVKSSEESATQSKILKDALVKDLKEILTELTQEQIKASSTGSAQLGQQIVESLQSGLKEPLDKIAGAVRQVGEDQGSAVNKLLTDVLAGFSQRLQELFGGQIAGINEMQQKTVDALVTAVGKIEQMAASLEESGQKGAQAMAEKLTAAMEAMEARQKVMNDRMADFVEQIRTAVGDAQKESGAKLQTLLADLSTQVSGVVETLKIQAEKAAEENSVRERQIAATTRQTIEQVGEQTQTIIGEVGKLIEQLQAHTSAIQNVTLEAVAKMNTGADTLSSAASEFARAGQSVTGVITQVGTVTDKLTQATGTVASSLRILESTVTDYKDTRNAVAQLLSDLKQTVENAKKETGITTEIINGIQEAARRLTDAERQAETYLQKVGDVLAKAHQEFADKMKQTLGQANNQFYTELTKATGLLRDAIEELSATVETVPAR